MRTFALYAGALAVVVSSGCREIPSTFAPRPVAVGTGLVSFTAGGPVGLTLGEQAQFSASAYFENRQQVNVTLQTAWSSSEPAVLTVGPDGVAAAHAPGSATVSATYQDRTVAKPVVVMPAGTFRLEVEVWGLFHVLLPAKRPVGAIIDVIAGVGAGQRASFIIGDELPAYVLYGVAGPITIAISSPGFVTQTIDLTVQSHIRQQIVLSPAPAPPPPPED